MLLQHRDEIRFINPLGDTEDEAGTFEAEEGASSPTCRNFEDEQRDPTTGTQQQT